MRGVRSYYYMGSGSVSRQILNFSLSLIYILDYSRVEVASDTRHSARCCGRPPLLRCNEVDEVRSARPKGKRCRYKLNILPYSDVLTMVSADFMNNSGYSYLPIQNECLISNPDPINARPNPIIFFL